MNYNSHRHVLTQQYENVGITVDVVGSPALF